MKRVCKFSVHDYMDMYPSDAYYVFAGENEDEILDKAKGFETHMKENYSGGTTTFVKFLSNEETEKLYNDSIKSLRDSGSDEDLMRADEIEKELHEICG